jgi:RHS repeat-associated protein
MPQFPHSPRRWFETVGRALRDKFANWREAAPQRWSALLVRFGNLSPIRKVALVALLAIVVMCGPTTLLISQTDFGRSIGQTIFGKDNLANPQDGTKSVTHLPATPTPPSYPKQQQEPPMPHGFIPSMKPGILHLDPKQSAHFLGSDGRLEVNVPAGAVDQKDVATAQGGLSLRLTEIAPASGTNAGGSGVISLGGYLAEVVDGKGNVVNHGLRQPATVSLHYTDKDSLLDLNHAFVVFNGARPKSIKGPLGQVSRQQVKNDAKNHTISAQIAADPSLTASTGSSSQAKTNGAQPLSNQITNSQQTPLTTFTWNTYPPIAKFGSPDPLNVDLNAGSLTQGIKIDAPPGPAGAMPNVTLAYNSGAVSEQHSPQGAAGWVGEGWSMSLGAITWAEHNVTANCIPTCGNTWQSSWMLTDPFGTSTELLPPSIPTSTYYDDSPFWYCATGNASSVACPIQFHTARETYAKVYAYVGPNSLGAAPHHPPCFRVYLKNGVMEEFGCTADSLQYMPILSGSLPGGTGNPDNYYPFAWHLDLITNAQGDQVHITYQNDTTTAPDGLTYPRDLVMSTVEWDSPTCVNASTLCNGGTAPNLWQPHYRVQFAATHHTISRLTNTPTGCNPDVSVRCDDPIDLSGSGGVRAPLVNGTFALNDINVQVNNTSGGSYNGSSWNTVRDYQLSYEQSGPTQITDPATGMQLSSAGYFDLTKIAQVGTDGTTAYPSTTMTYSTQTQYYEDGSYTPYNTTTGCGPSWNTGGNGGVCDLWSQTRDGNSRYLTTISNGMGLAQTLTWANARNNTHGVNSPGNALDPLYCNTHQTGYPCNSADDQAWSRTVVTARDDTVQQITQNGQGGAQTSIPVTSHYAYTYALTSLTAKECLDCLVGMYWGNQNDGDYLDYYNSHFMGFAQASVSKPDGSLETHKFYSTEGFGVFSTAQVLSCPSTLPPLDTTCHASPWWDLGNAGHGLEYDATYTDTNGTTILKHTRNTYQAVCPPSGVSPTPAFGSFNWGQLISALDRNNPVADCDVQLTQSDVFTNDGASDADAAHNATEYLYDGYGRVWHVTNMSGSGLKGEYYDNSDFTNLKLTRAESPINFNWGVGSPDPSMGVDTFSVRWTGYVQATSNETYTFYTTTDDGARLWVNGTQLVNAWVDEPPTEHSGSIALSAGQWYPITFEYYENGSGAMASLSYSTPSISKRIIPSAFLATKLSSSGSPTIIGHTNTFVWNDGLSVPAQARNNNPQTNWGGTYLIDVTASSTTEDEWGTKAGCQYTSFDSGAYTTGQTSGLTKGNSTTQDRYTSCNGTPTGKITTTATYDNAGNLVSSTDPDANSGVGGHTGCLVSGDPTARTNCTAYSDLTQAKTTQDTNNQNQSTTTGYDYTSAGGFGLWPVSTTDANGQVTTTAYDVLGRVTSTRLPGQTTGPASIATNYKYWCSGTAAQTPCYEVDSVKRINSTTTVTSRTFYDGFNRLVETRAPATGGKDTVTYYLYNSSGHTTKVSAPYLVTAYTGPADIAAYSIPDSSVVVTTVTYDGLGRTKQITDLLTHAWQASYSIVCNAAGTSDAACYEQTLATDANSHRTGTLVDSFGRTIYEQRYTGNATYTLYTTTKSTYDIARRMTQVKHPNGTSVTSYAYDTTGRLISMSDPDRGNEYYCYDANGNQTLRADARSSGGTACSPSNNLGTVYTGYDGLNRPAWRNNVNSQTGAYATWSYDSVAGGNNGKGRLTGETFNASGSLGVGSYAYTYDALGRKTAQTTVLDGTTYTYAFGFNDASMPTSMTYSDNEVTTYSYDTASAWLTGITTTPSGGTAKSLINSVAYAGIGGAAGKPTSATLDGGTYTYTAAFDNALRLTTLTVKKGNQTRFNSTRTYDNAGNVATVATTLQAGTDNQKFCYDDLNRLTWAGSTGTSPCNGAVTAGTLTAAQYTQTYAYDAMDRLATGPAGTYTYGDSAHLHAATSTSGNYTATYDATGDLTCRAPTSATTCAGTQTGAQLTYDAEGRLTHWQNAPSSPTTTDDYVYDGEGNRLAQKVISGGTTTTTYYMGTEEVKKVGATITITKYYASGGLPMVMKQDTTYSYLASDGLGSVSEALGTGGSATSQQLFTAYGASRYSSGTWPTQKGYTGQYGDATTGLAYYNARYYDPALGQFASADTASSGGLNRFGYVAGNPTTATDPTGHMLTTDGGGGGGSASPVVGCAATGDCYRGGGTTTTTTTTTTATTTTTIPCDPSNPTTVACYKWRDTANGIRASAMATLNFKAALAFAGGAALILLGLTVEFASQRNPVRLVELVVDIASILANTFIPALGIIVNYLFPQLKEAYRLALIASTAINEVMGLVYTVRGWLKTGGWILETLVSGAIVTIKASAGGLPGLITSIAASLFGEALSYLATGFGFQLFAQADATLYQKDVQERMPIKDWCDQYDQQKCGALPTN